MKVLVINLDRAKERWLSVTKQIQDAGMNPIRVEAIDSKQMKISNVSNKCKYLCPKVSVAITMSHIKAWNIALNYNQEKYLICEDDVVLQNNFKHLLDLYSKDLPPNWDILFVGCLFCQKNSLFANILLNLTFKKNTRSNENFSNHLKIPQFVFGSHAYIVSKAGIKKLLNHFKFIENAVDIQMNDLIAQNKLNAFSLKNILASQDVSVHSSSISQKMPRIASKLDKVLIAPQVSLRYGLSYPIMNIQSFDITGWTYIVFFYGIFSGLKLSFLKSSAILVILLSPDIIEKDKAAIGIFVSFLFGWIIGFALKKK